jgi:hypothetical protein
LFLVRDGLAFLKGGEDEQDNQDDVEQGEHIDGAGLSALVGHKR